LLQHLNFAQIIQKTIFIDFAQKQPVLKWNNPPMSKLWVTLLSSILMMTLKSFNLGIYNGLKDKM
jgi:hypothetical protein